MSDSAAKRGRARPATASKTVAVLMIVASTQKSGMRLHDRIEFASPMPQPVASVERATIPIFNSAELESASKRAIEDTRVILAQIENIPLDAVTPEGVLDTWDRAAIVLEDAF